MMSLKKLKRMKYNSTKLSAKTSGNPQQQHKVLSQFQSGTTEYNHIFTNQTGYWRVRPKKHMTIPPFFFFEKKTRHLLI
jgi:hypothetical protein